MITLKIKKEGNTLTFGVPCKACEKVMGDKLAVEGAAGAVISKTGDFVREREYAGMHVYCDDCDPGLGVGNEGARVDSVETVGGMEEIESGEGELPADY